MTQPGRYVALLRAINVGGHTVKMDRLRGLFEQLGLANVATFIASGNVIFDAPGAEPRALEQQIEAHLRAALGYEVATFLRTPAELTLIASHQPRGLAEPGEDMRALYVAFLREPPAPTAAERLLAFESPIDQLFVHGREVYWLCRSGIGESPLSGPTFEKLLGMPATMRNITTVRKLAAKYAPSS